MHVIPRDCDEMARLFGHETGDDVDKFAVCAWTRGPGGVPLLDACPVRFVGRVLDRRDLGDHTGYVLEPVLAEGRGTLRATTSASRTSRTSTRVTPPDPARSGW